LILTVSTAIAKDLYCTRGLVPKVAHETAVLICSGF
jgi:hypothetical protein